MPYRRHRICNAFQCENIFRIYDNSGTYLARVCVIGLSFARSCRHIIFGKPNQSFSLKTPLSMLFAAKTWYSFAKNYFIYFLITNNPS